MGFIIIFISGKYKNDNLLDFRTRLLDELNYSLKTYEHLKSESIDLNEYKFGLVNSDHIITEYVIMNEAIIKALMDPLRNLMIVGTNFNIEKFKRHQIFNEWFDDYTNRI